MLRDHNDQAALGLAPQVLPLNGSACEMDIAHDFFAPLATADQHLTCCMLRRSRAQQLGCQSWLMDSVWPLVDEAAVPRLEKEGFHLYVRDILSP